MKEIGQEIQQARLEKGFTLEEIANHTRIQLSHLQKIENGQFDFLPRPYVVAFIKTFAQHVGLNGDLLIKRWRELEQVEAARAQEQPTQQPPHRKGPERRKTAVLTSSPKPMEPYAVPTSYFPYLKEILIGFGMVLVMALLIYLMSKTGGEKTKIEQDNPAQSSQLNQPSRVQEIPFSEVTKEVAAKAQVSIPSVPEDLTLQARFDSQTRMRVITDGADTSNAIYRAGEVQTWRAKEKFELRIGIASAVTLTLEGKNLGKFGQAGQIEYLTITREGIVAKRFARPRPRTGASSDSTAARPPSG